MGDRLGTPGVVGFFFPREYIITYGSVEMNSMYVHNFGMTYAPEVPRSSPYGIADSTGRL